MNTKYILIKTIQIADVILNKFFNVWHFWLKEIYNWIGPINLASSGRLRQKIAYSYDFQVPKLKFKYFHFSNRE